ncbi:uncharacterized protein METZ01_LOCUS203320, partial [marine metagenome]
AVGPPWRGGTATKSGWAWVTRRPRVRRCWPPPWRSSTARRGRPSSATRRSARRPTSWSGSDRSWMPERSTSTWLPSRRPTPNGWLVQPRSAACYWP